MDLSPHNIELRPVDYPQDILDAAGKGRPGGIITFGEGLEHAVNISRQSPRVFWEADGQKFPDGPFGALRFAVRATDMFRMIRELRDATPQQVIDRLSSIKGLVCGIGWNCVNGARTDGVFSNPVAHGEMVAMMMAGRAVPLRVYQWKEYDICFVEATSSEDCESCASRNGRWGGTVLSLFALLTREVLTGLGFDEGDACHEDNRKIGESWANIVNHEVNQYGMSSVYLPGHEGPAREAYVTYQRNGGRLYQADYSEKIAAAACPV